MSIDQRLTSGIEVSSAQGEEGDASDLRDQQDFALRTAGAAILMTAAALAFFMAPLLRFYNPGLFATAGGAFIAGAMYIWISWRLDFHKSWSGVSYFIFAATVAQLAYLTYDACKASESNDARCRVIQHDMLSANPIRSDGPDLFAALQCRPTGDESVSVSAKPVPPKRAVGPAR